jgi:hypothetical protein
VVDPPPELRIWPPAATTHAAAAARTLSAATGSIGLALPFLFFNIH